MECDAIRIASASSHTCCSAKRACLPWTAWVGTSHPKTASFHTCSDISNIFPPAKSWLHKLGNWVQIWWKMMKNVTWPFKFYFLKTSPKASSLRRRRIDAQLCFQFPPENQHILIPSTSWHLRLPETFKFQHVYQHFLRDLAAASLSRISRHRQHFDCGLTSWDPQVKLDLDAMFGN